MGRIVKPIAWIILCCLLGGLFVFNQINADQSGNNTAAMVAARIAVPAVPEKKFRLGHAASIATEESTAYLYSIFEQMEEAGLISGFAGRELSSFSYDVCAVWDYAAENIKSDFFELVQDFNYDFETVEPDGALERLKNEEIDLLLCYGTRAGIAVFNNTHHVPTVNYGSSDPIYSGLLLDENTAPYDHLWAHIDTGTVSNQIHNFYNIFQFKKLGVFEYADSFRKAFTPRAELERLAGELGFELIIEPFYGIDDYMDGTPGYEDAVLEINQRLAAECDAVYQILGAYDYSLVPELYAPFFEADIPIFSTTGPAEVKSGLLMSLGNIDFSDIGSHVCEVVLRIMAGETPNHIPKLYHTSQGIVLNLQAAKQIKYKPALKFLLICDEVAVTGN